MSKAEGKGWVGRALAGGAVRWIGFQLATVVGPMALGGLTLLLGRIQDGSGWMWPIVGASLAFGGASAGCFYTLGVWDRFRVSGRLAARSARVALSLTSKGVGLGFDLENSSDMPIEFEVETIRTQLADRWAPNKPFSCSVIPIPAKGVGWFVDHVIEIDLEATASRVLEGTVEAIVKYGRPGSRRHRLQIGYKVFLDVGQDGSIRHSVWESLLARDLSA